jgi:uncharacterized protein YceK
MRKSSSVIAVLALLAATSGCGTTANITQATIDTPPKPFGGLAYDFHEVATGNPLYLIDLPGSLVGDIATLPDVLIAKETVKLRPSISTSAGEGADAAVAAAAVRPNPVSKKPAGSQPAQSTSVESNSE